MRREYGVALAIMLLACTGRTAMAQQKANSWAQSLLAFPYERPTPGAKATYALIRQDHETLQINRSVIGTPLRIGSRNFVKGLGTHAVSHIRLSFPKPIVRLTGWYGVDHNDRTRGGAGSVVFTVESSGDVLLRSGTARGGEEPVRLDLALPSVRQVDLRVDDAGDGPACDHADWADLRAVSDDGAVFAVADFVEGFAEAAARYPFSFRYGGKSSDDLLPAWRQERKTSERPGGGTSTDVVWTEPNGGLVVRFSAVAYGDFAAVDWVLRFSNGGSASTPLIEDVRVLDIVFDRPAAGSTPYLVHRTAGGTPTPEQFESEVRPVGGRRAVDLGAGAGRSSTRDFPFFTVEMRDAAVVVAVGWSGNWSARAEAPDSRRLHLTVGMERTRFVLHPGEHVRSPSIVLLRGESDAYDAEARFRLLVGKHYAARRSGKPILPVLFSNTCFTRGGGWLNECTAENQISLINAYAPLGLEAVITDAGWFEGGWPAGAGNWTPRKDAYPQGMGPVAAAALRHKMVYGLWFEPERVVAGTELHRLHPEWCLASRKGAEPTYLANFALPEVRDYFHRIVAGFMALPGFRVYRQDFNMDPLPYWRFNDAPDRQGMTEMLYMEGLYAFWDGLAEAWPDSLREECASGGHRMDIETVRRFHLHQKTDYWFDNEVDQASIWSLSRYLPNSTFVAPIARLDEYTFHSVFATSMCVGWIADAEEFPTQRAAKMLSRYLALRHFLVGAYYPLTGYSRLLRDWQVSQYHRADMNAGILIVLRRGQSPYPSVEVRLRGLDPKALYDLTSQTSSKVTRLSGADLMRRLVLALPEPRMSDILVYRKVAK